MRAKKAKALRRAIYGDQSPRVRRYVRGAVTGQIRRRDLGGAYRMAKAESRRQKAVTAY
jgi:hypothetical protein